MSLPDPFSQTRGILLTDFDGTLTRRDFYDVVLQRYPEIAAHAYWERYTRGEMTHFQAMQAIYGELRATPEEMADILRALELDPNLPDAVWRLEQEGWDIIVVSGGCEWYIRSLLDAVGVSLEIHSNPGTFDPDRGLQLRLPEGSPYFSPTIGVDKAAAVRAALTRASRVAYAGDGRPDLSAALLVEPRLRFARGWLAGELQGRGEGYRAFERWSQIADLLLAEA